MFPNKTGRANRYTFKQIRQREKMRCYLWNTEKPIQSAFCFPYTFSGTYLFLAN